MSNPTCQHCGTEYDEEETWTSSYGVESGDGDLSELNCLNADCEKKFYVMCRHDIKWSACDEYGNDVY